MTRVAEPTKTVAVIGAGFSGLICALHLLTKSERERPRIYLIEKRQAFGAGAAYSTNLPDHLVNTRAANMSAFVDRPEHFLNWLQASSRRFEGNGASFVSRRTYRDYLQHLLREAVCNADAVGRLYLVYDEAVELKPAGGRFAVHLNMGRVLHVDAAILATGNPPPHPLNVPAADFFNSPIYIDDPWREAAFDAVEPGDTVFAIGTGLTMIDTVLSLRRRGHVGRIMALSRRGLVPLRHAKTPKSLDCWTPFSMSQLSLILKTVRVAIGKAMETGENWQDAIDSLRPRLPALWQSLPDDAKRRFIRHLHPWWNVHRYRLAPEIADSLGEWIAGGSLVICRGKLVSLKAEEHEGAVRANISWRAAGDRSTHCLHANYVINCTGPGSDPTRSKTPLISGLLASGLARPDRLRLGLDVDSRGRLIDESGIAAERLFALGPPTRGVFWEATAVRDIRQQAENVAISVLQALDAVVRAPEIVS